MKRKITILIGLSLIAAMAFTSCEKDDETNPEEKKLYPTKITEYDDGVIDDNTIYEYNANKQLIKTDYGYDYYETFEYDADGRLQIIKEYDNNEMYKYDSLEYNVDNQVVKIQEYQPSGEKRGWYVLEYDLDGNLSKKSEYLTDGSIYSYNEYTFDTNGNMLSEKYFYEDYTTGTIPTDVYDETVYEYDSKNNIYKSWGAPFMWESHVNNIIKEVFTQTPDGQDNYSVIYSYKYNSDNYPSEYTEDGDKFVIEYEEL